MRLLITAGNTQVPIDRVRCITNIFTGQTGAAIAKEALTRGHSVRLLTSHPETVSELGPNTDRWQVEPYRSFDDLEIQLGACVRSGEFDAIIHSAAVSDYQVTGIYAFPRSFGTWNLGQTSPANMMQKLDEAKVKSHHRELWLRLEPTPKLVDKIRADWFFRGILVKFKLEAGVSEAQLLDVAEGSRQQSRANLLVANTLEDRDRWAIILGPLPDQHERINRADLPARLLDAVEALHRASTGARNA